MSGLCQVAACAFLAVPTGCATRGTPVIESGSGAQTVVVADWNDVYAAVLVAVGRNESAILSWTSGNSEQVFRLRTIRDECGELVARRRAGGAVQDPSSIELTCRIGVFGRPELEQSLLRDTSARLRDLAGVEYRPLR